MSFMSSGSLSARRRQRDSDEVMDSLNDFLAARKQALDRSAKAMEDYEEEMDNIGDIYESDAEEEGADEYVDHNMMRHINAGGAHGSDSDSDESAGQSARYEIDRLATEESNVSNNVFRAPKLTPQQRHELREGMITYFDEARSQEQELESALDYEMESGEEFPMKTFAELNQLHHTNYKGMMHRLNEYGPKPLGKVWLEDEDFKRLAGTLRRMQFQELESSAARQEFSSLKHKKRVRQKREQQGGGR